MSDVLRVAVRDLSDEELGYLLRGSISEAVRDGSITWSMAVWLGLACCRPGHNDAESFAVARDAYEEGRIADARAVLEMCEL